MHSNNGKRRNGVSPSANTHASREDGCQRQRDKGNNNKTSGRRAGNKGRTMQASSNGVPPARLWFIRSVAMQTPPSSSSAASPFIRASISMINNFFTLIAIVGVASRSAAGGEVVALASDIGHRNIPPHRSLPLRSPRNLAQDNGGQYQAPDGSCSLGVSTPAVLKEGDHLVAGTGFVFAIKSDDAAEDDLEITSFGFHVEADFSAPGALVGYEVFALNGGVEGGGYYANFTGPTATDSFHVDSGSEPDYRGKSEHWQSIAKGTISQQNLTKSTTTIETIEDDFYMIPFESFTPTSIPAAGGVRSFYISTDTSAIITSTSGGKHVNDEMDLDDEYGLKAPKILVGQGVPEWIPQPLLYNTKAFVGRVYYETECNSQAPSVSAQPSGQPSLPTQKRPSTGPSEHPSLYPSSVPSLHPSSMPSFAPTPYTEKLSTGLLLQLYMACEPGKQFPKEQEKIVADVVADTARRATMYLDPPIDNMKAEVRGVVCRPPVGQSRLLLDRTHFSMESVHRYLPVGSSALDFSLVISGEYRTPCRPGRKCDSKPDYDLGSLAEDSINRDTRGFVKTLKDRAKEFSTSSPFAELNEDDLAVESFEVLVTDNGEIELPDIITRTPTQAPTPPPPDQKVLLMCIVVTSGLIVILGAFVLFRYAERRANEARRKKIARREKEKEIQRWETQQRLAWEQEYKQFMGMAVKNAPPPPPQSKYPGIDKQSQDHYNSFTSFRKQNAGYPPLPLPPKPAPRQTTRKAEGSEK